MRGSVYSFSLTGAGTRDRTGDSSLGSSRFTTKLCPQGVSNQGGSGKQAVGRCPIQKSGVVGAALDCAAQGHRVGVGFTAAAWDTETNA